ncbi:outer membrane lipoprotein carrier protein LolA [Dyella sp. OK004]|uniref:LolA family protein n=1 Tax=Dyella sp. OK004 TaxID=1855292 RepID=UPI000B891209|nr:outer membrane lipoprotein carrier protein LolA [Dyella sp. OK004]
MTALLCWIALCCTTLGAQAQDSGLLQQILDELGGHTSVRAAFTQSRENPALAQPQVSRGQLLFVVGRGMLWQVDEPFRETLALTGGRTARVDEQGHAQPVRGGDRGVAQVSQMLQSMLSGKPEDALRQFDVQAEGSTARWTLHFTPRQERMARVLRRIDLDGDRFLQGIRVELQGGESTQIRFADTRDAGELSPLEKRALGMPP